MLELQTRNRLMLRLWELNVAANVSVYVCVSCYPMCNVRTDGWLQLWGLPLPRMQSAQEDVLAVKDKKLDHGMLTDGSRACLIAITHNRTHACLCLSLLYAERSLLSCLTLIFTQNEPSLMCNMILLQLKCKAGDIVSVRSLP